MTTLGELSDRAAELSRTPMFMAIRKSDFDRLCVEHPRLVFAMDRDLSTGAEPALAVGYNWFAVPGEMPDVQQETTT